MSDRSNDGSKKPSRRESFLNSLKDTAYNVRKIGRDKSSLGEIYPHDEGREEEPANEARSESIRPPESTRPTASTRPTEFARLTKSPKPAESAPPSEKKGEERVIPDVIDWKDAKTPYNRTRLRRKAHTSGDADRAEESLADKERLSTTP